MIINSLDFGASHPWRQPLSGLELGKVLIEGGRGVYFGHGTTTRSWSVTFQAHAIAAIGGQAALSAGAVKYLLTQLEELAGNPAMNPVYIQWEATAEAGAPLNTTTQHDGWYFISQVQADYAHSVVSGLVTVQMMVVEHLLGPARGTAAWYSGGALTSNYSAGAMNLLAFPLNAVIPTFSTRVGGEGSIPTILGPLANVQPYEASATISDWFKCSCHMYDTINTGSNPVPTSGAFVSANWVEVFGTDHKFAGDCVITNGLLLFLVQIGQANITSYLWDTTLITPAWTNFANFQPLQSEANVAVKQYFPLRVSADEIQLQTVVRGTRSYTNNTYTYNAGEDANFTLRLQRGQYYLAFDVRPRDFTIQSPIEAFALSQVSGNPMMYNSTAAGDSSGFDSGVAVATDYGYGAGFPKGGGAGKNYLFGNLYQNKPGGFQPRGGLLAGDLTTQTQNVVRTYGIFAVPYANVVNLQAEAESGALGTGWSNFVDALASAGHAAKCASGTLSTNADLFGTSWSPTPGNYNVFFRVQVTSAAGNVAEMTLGLWNGAAFTASTTFKANQASTSYIWLKANVAVMALNGTYQFRAVTAATLGTDWFIDEAILAPATFNANGPQDLWQEFLYDKAVRIPVLS